MNSTCRTLAILATALLLAGPANSDDQSSAGPYAAGKQVATLVDDSRPATGSRSLKTSLWYPAQARPVEWLRPGPAPLATDVCPAPLVIYSHGFMSMRHNGAYLGRYLASQGYIVAAPDFPRTRLGKADAEAFTDVLNQPGDISFIIDSLLARSDAFPANIATCIDPQRIAAVGLSLGGLTTTLLAFHPTLGDARLRAAVAIAGPVALLGPGFFHDAAPPFMMLAGDLDAMVDYAENVPPLADWHPAATIVTLQGGSHTGFAGLAGWLMSWLDNPDSVGCSALRARLDDDTTIPDGFLMQLRGNPAADGATPELRPCSLPELPPAMQAQHQLMLTSLSIYTFLQSVLDPDPVRRADYGNALRVTLPTRHPELHSGVLPTASRP